MNRPKSKPEEREDEITYHGYISYSARFDVLWPRLREVIAFVGGFGIILYEALADSSDRPWLYAAAIGMMGLPIARAAEGIITNFSPGSEQQERKRSVK